MRQSVDSKPAVPDGTRQLPRRRPSACKPAGPEWRSALPWAALVSCLLHLAAPGCASDSAGSESADDMDAVNTVRGPSGTGAPVADPSPRATSGVGPTVSPGVDPDVQAPPAGSPAPGAGAVPEPPEPDALPAVEPEAPEPAAGVDTGAPDEQSDEWTGSSTGPSGACSRAQLESALDEYFAALSAHDPAGLSVAPTAKFTENGEALALGEAGLWLMAGTVRHMHGALDTDTCTAVAQAVIPDGEVDIPFMVRLRVTDQGFDEIETIAVRRGDYTLASDTVALAESAVTVGWEDPVPPPERNTREDIAAWMEKYFRMFPRGVCDTTSNCTRIENGGGSFSCSAGASCDSRAPGPGDDVLKPRLVLVDIERGLGVGFTMFQGNTDMHLIKMYGGQVHGVSAILAAAPSSGWE